MPLQQTLIQEQEVINGGGLRPTPLPNSFDALLLTPHIKTAMHRHVRDFLGATFYNALLTEKGTTVSNYNEDLGGLVPAFTTPAYETLWKEYLLELCANAVVYEAIPFIVTQLCSNGILELNIETGTNGGLRAGQYLQDTMLERIKLNKKELREFLCDNAVTYTLYDSKTECDDCKKDNTSDFLGVIIYD